MAKFIFTKPYSTRIPATGRAGEGEGDGKITVRFKVGDLIDGDVVRNTISSEPPNFLMVANPKLKIGFGGRGWNTNGFFMPYSETTTLIPNIDATPKPKSQPQAPTDNSSQPITKEPTKSIFTPQNIVIGVFAFVSILGLLKWRKII